MKKGLLRHIKQEKQGKYFFFIHSFLLYKIRDIVQGGENTAEDRQA